MTRRVVKFEGYVLIKSKKIEEYTKEKIHNIFCDLMDEGTLINYELEYEGID
jgi:hypothetical protein